MTLRDMEWQGLLILPKEKDWKNHDGISLRNSKDLTLVYVKMWGFNKGNDTGIRLFCEDKQGVRFEAEISRFSDCLSRTFMSYFFVECKNRKLADIFSRELKIDARDAEYESMFDREFVRPGLADMRCAYFAKQEEEAETRVKKWPFLAAFAMLRKAVKAR